MATVNEQLDETINSFLDAEISRLDEPLGNACCVCLVNNGCQSIHIGPGTPVADNRESHIVCAECLDRLKSTTFTNEMVKCPLCRSQTPHRGTRQYQSSPNRYAEDMLEIIGNIEQMLAESDVYLRNSDRLTGDMRRFLTNISDRGPTLTIIPMTRRAVVRLSITPEYLYLFFAFLLIMVAIALGQN
jgi:hypothetical protein